MMITIDGVTYSLPTALQQGPEGMPAKGVTTTSSTSLPGYTATVNVLTAFAVGSLPALDSVTLSVGDEVLLIGETGGNAVNNRIWRVNSIGSATTKWVLTATPNISYRKGSVAAIAGGTNAKFSYILTTDNPIIVGSTALTWERGLANTVLSDAIPLPLGTATPGTSTASTREGHVHAHGNLSGGTLHAVATTAVAGFMSAADKVKVDASLTAVSHDSTLTGDGTAGSPLVVVGGGGALPQVASIGTASSPGALRLVVGSLIAGQHGVLVAKGFLASGDGGGGTFEWTTDTTSADDGGMVIVPDVSVMSPRTGCWKRLHNGVIFDRWFGVKGDDSTDDTAALQKFFDAAGSTGSFSAASFFTGANAFRAFEFRIGPGIFRVFNSSTNSYALRIRHAVKLSGTGGQIYSSRIKIMNDGWGILVEGPSDNTSRTRGVEITNLSIASTSGNTKSGLVIHGHSCVIRDCYFSFFSFFGLIIESGTVGLTGTLGGAGDTGELLIAPSEQPNGTYFNANFSSVQDCWFNFCGVQSGSDRGELLGGGGMIWQNYDSNGAYVLGGRADFCSLGFIDKSSSGVTHIRCYTQQCYYGYASSAAYQTSYYDCHSEDINASIVKIFSGAQPLVVGGTLISDPGISQKIGARQTKLVFRDDSAIKSSGSITVVAGSLINDGGQFVLNDGVNPAVTFEYDSNGSVTQTNTLRSIAFTTSDSAATVAAATRTAINNAPILSITADAPVGASIALTNDTPGASGNITITETVTDAGFTVSGMTGGEYIQYGAILPNRTQRSTLEWNRAVYGFQGGSVTEDDAWAIQYEPNSGETLSYRNWLNKTWAFRRKAESGFTIGQFQRTPFGFTDRGHTRGELCLWVANPTLNTDRHWTWRQTNLSIPTGRHLVYMNGNVDSDGGSGNDIVFDKLDNTNYANVSKRCIVTAKLAIADIQAGASVTVGAWSVVRQSTASGNYVVEVTNNGGSTVTITLEWSFDDYVTLGLSYG